MFLFGALGLVCLAGACSKLPSIDGASCSEAHPCGEGYYCDKIGNEIEGKCTVAFKTVVQCTKDEDCPDRLVCDIEALRCRPCVEDSDCDGSAVCLGGNERRCVACAGDADCASGRCVANQCAGCSTDGECKASDIGCLPGKEGKCANCATNADCTTNLCVGQVCRRCWHDDLCEGGTCQEGVCKD